MTGLAHIRLSAHLQVCPRGHILVLRVAVMKWAIAVADVDIPWLVAISSPAHWLGQLTEMP